MRNPDFLPWRNQRRRSASQYLRPAKLVSAFVFATLISEIRNFKLLAIFCDCTCWFVSDLVGDPEARFSRVAAQIKIKTELTKYTRGAYSRLYRDVSPHRSGAYPRQYRDASPHRSGAYPRQYRDASPHRSGAYPRLCRDVSPHRSGAYRCFSTPKWSVSPSVP